MMRTSLLFALVFPLLATAQPCMTSYTMTADPPPVNGTYACGQTVTFCFTVTNWNATGANWFHGIEANFGPGWDLATLVPGAPPATCGPSTGTWDWYGLVSGQGPGFFFDLDSDGDPANNFGDFCTGATDWEFCWTISVLSAPACADGLGLGVNINTFSDSQTGSWGTNGCGGDDNPPVFPGPVVISACTANAGTNATLDLCTTSGALALIGVLAGTPDAGGAWTDPGGATNSGTFDPTIDGSGDYTYTVTATGCSDQAVVTVLVNTQPDAGLDGLSTVCASDPAVDLFALLGGVPDPSGTWSDPDGLASTGTFTPGTGTPGTYLYTVSAAAPCIDVTSGVTIDVNPTPTAGSNGNTQFCSTGTATDLLAALNGLPDAGGTWADAGGAAFGGTYDPALHAPGVFTYTVLGAAPCPNSSATVTVAENLQPDAGGGTTLSFCATDAAVGLTTLLEGSPDAGGTWSGPGGALPSNMLDPAIAPSGAYVYTVNAVAPCVDAQATLDITLVPAADAGTSGNLTLCDGSVATDLFGQLGGTPDPGGTWTSPSGAPVSATFDPVTSAPGTYTYTVAGSAPCADHSETVLVAVTSQPDAGDDAVAQLCESGTVVDLNDLLNGTPQAGGTWTDPTGYPAGSSLTPATAANGDYTYTITGTAPCMDDAAVVSISVVGQLSAGSDGATTLCSTSAAIGLFDLLGGTPESTGSWTTPSGGAATGTFDPAVHVPGTYTYTVDAPAPCPSSSAAVTVAVEQQPDAGTDDALTVCSSDNGAHTLLTELSGNPDAGGSWTDPTGTAHGASFNGATDAPGTYTYTLPAQAPCVAVSSMVDIDLVEAPDAGVDGAVSVCEDGAAIDLTDWTSGPADAGGTWTAPSGAPVVSVDPSIGPSGNYTYTVTGTAPCPDAQAVVTLTISALPNAGSDGVLDLCPEAPSTALLPSLGAGAQPGGTWSGPDGSLGGSFVPGTSTPGLYTYTVAGTGGCAGSTTTAAVTVGVQPSPEPAFSIGISNGCAPLQTLFTYTGTAVQNATWSFGDGATSTDIGPAYHVYTNGGVFDVQLTVTDANGCVGSAVQQNAVHVSDGPEAFFTPSAVRISVENPVFGVVHSPEEGIAYVWTLDDAAITGGGTFDHTITPAVVGLHPICLTATDAMGCSNVWCVEIMVDDVLTVFVPNAFTPDGNDLNEVFRPSILGADPALYSFRVFDRWGNEVFSTTDLHESWNGARGNSGEIVPQDVYVWRILVHDQFTTERKEYSGIVTVLK